MGIPVSRAWNFRFPVRLSCGHLVTFSGTSPWPGEHVWCGGCECAAQVGAYYYDPQRPTGWCGVIACDGDRYLRCTLDKGHDPAKHRDGPLDTWFAPPGPLRSSREGNCG